MGWPRRTAAGLVTLALGASPLLGTPVPAAAEPASVGEHRSYQAAVNLLDPEANGTAGLVGGVSFTAVVGGSTSVNVFLSRNVTVVCEDGSEDFETLTVRTATAEATTPGPIDLDIDRRLRTATGVAVVDLVEEYSAGCGQDPTITLLPSRTVTIAVEGTTVRFRTGMESRASTAADTALLRSVDFSRDGVGSATVDSYVQDVSSGAAFLKYAVDRTLTRGATVELPPNAAPAGGSGAMGAFSRERQENGQPVFEDVFVTATVGAAPTREQRIDAFALRSMLIPCAAGGYGEVLQVTEGRGTASVIIDARLAHADAAGTIPANRSSFNGCTGVLEESTEPVRVSLSLAADGAVVRSVDTRFQVRPGDGVTRARLTYRARPATGIAVVGDIAGPTDLASITRAGR